MVMFPSYSFNPMLNNETHFQAKAGQYTAIFQLSSLLMQHKGSTVITNKNSLWKFKTYFHNSHISISTAFQTVLQPEVLLLYLPEPTNGLYPEPDESCPCSSMFSHPVSLNDLLIMLFLLSFLLIN